MNYKQFYFDGNELFTGSTFIRKVSPGSLEIIGDSRLRDKKRFIKISKKKFIKFRDSFYGGRKEN